MYRDFTHFGLVKEPGISEWTPVPPLHLSDDKRSLESKMVGNIRITAPKRVSGVVEETTGTAWISGESVTGKAIADHAEKWRKWVERGGLPPVFYEDDPRLPFDPHMAVVCRTPSVAKSSGFVNFPGRNLSLSDRQKPV